MLTKNIISTIIYSLALLTLFIAPNFLGLLTDWYWFQEIGFTTIFTTILISKIFLLFSFYFLGGRPGCWGKTPFLPADKKKKKILQNLKIPPPNPRKIFAIRMVV